MVAVLTMALAFATGCRPATGALAEAQDRPGRLVRLPDGRMLNLRCAGHGAPTVVLESGFGADSHAWFKVQPAIAAITRVCAYDRAGYGFSEPGPQPRSGAAIARDLDQALTEANLAGPYVVVGHSAGGLYARLFAARRPGDVVGLVFLDPTVERLAPDDSVDADGLGGIRQRLRRCLAASLETQSSGALASTCVSRDRRPLSPAQWRSQLSELDNIFRQTSAETSRIGELLVDIPAYVITASDTAAAAPRVGLEQPQSTWELQHQQLAGRFQVSSQQTILSSHLVMIDRPDAAIAEILEMVRATRERRPPAPLPPSEWRLETNAASPKSGLVSGLPGPQGARSP